MKTLITLLAITLSVTAIGSPSIKDEFGPETAALIGDSPHRLPLPTEKMFPPRHEGDVVRLGICRNFVWILGEGYLFYFWAQVGAWSVGHGIHPIYPDLPSPKPAVVAVPKPAPVLIPKASTKPATKLTLTKPATFRPLSEQPK